MITLKEQFINDIRMAPEESVFKTIEVLDTGEQNEMTWVCSHENMLIILSSRFDDNLQGSVPNGHLTTIKGWEIIEKIEEDLRQPEREEIEAILSN